MKHTYAPFLLLGCLLMTACSNRYHQFASHYTFKNPDGNPDYSNLDDWAAHPYKQDPSDSVPGPLRAHYRPDSSVDIFFIHPTTYTSKEKVFGWNAPVDDAELNAKTDYSTILFQAGIFNEAGRVFSPRYRQAQAGPDRCRHQQPQHRPAATQTWPRWHRPECSPGTPSRSKDHYPPYRLP